MLQDATKNSDFASGFLDLDDLDSAKVGSTKNIKEFIEVCFKCGGSGRYNAPSSLGHNNCTKCNGTGRLVYKTSKLHRDTAKAKAADRKVKAEQKKRDEAEQNLIDFESAHQDIAAWWANTTFEFALSLKDAVKRFGKLTENQLAAAQRCVAKFNEAKAKSASAIANAKSVDVSAIETAFRNGKQKGIKRPKIRLLGGELAFVFSMAPDSGRNAGSLYVTSGEEYVGKITEGKFIKSRDCSEVTEKSVVAACIDPLNSAVAYGKRFGVCSCCGRELSNQESIDLGIGPICREKFF